MLIEDTKQSNIVNLNGTDPLAIYKAWRTVLNSGLDGQTQSMVSGKEEDLNLGPPDYKSGHSLK